MATAATVRADSPAYQAYQLLHLGFVAAPIIAGADKFFHFLTNWDMYLAPVVPQTLGMSAHLFMLIVGGVEVVAGVLTAFAPRIGGWVVGLWLCGIILNLLLLGKFYDVALRDLGLAIGAIALARLSVEFSDV
jgi:hypothetical protein